MRDERTPSGRDLDGDDARLVVHDREMHLDVFVPLRVGDTLKVIRGNGPREGDHMGTATVTGFEDDGSPVLSVRFDGDAEEPGGRV